MASSWRWSNDEEFEKYVQPHAIKHLNYVRRYAVSYCFGEVLQKLFDDIGELRVGVKALHSWLETHKTIDEEGLDIAIDLCHHGESMLLFQRRLAIGKGAYGFLHGKDGIEHSDHELTKHTSRHDLVQLHDDVEELLSAFDAELQEDARFLVDNVHELPEELLLDFRTSRDLCSVGSEEVGLMVCGRAFEKVVRAVMGRLGVQILSKKTIDAEKAMLNDLIESMRKLRWKENGEDVFSPQSIALMNWIRIVRNGAVHEGEEYVAGDERTTATLLAQISGRLWEMAKRNAMRQLESTIIQKDW